MVPQSSANTKLLIEDFLDLNLRYRFMLNHSQFFGDHMNICQVAEATGLTTKAIRHYESLGLIVPERQQGNDYRCYSLQDVDDLRFLQRSRAVGFGLEESGQLLDLYRNPEKHTAATKSLILRKLTQLDQQWLVLSLVRQTLTGMATKYAGELDKIINENQGQEKPENAMPFTLVSVSDDE